jgi:muramidase (phage lysozyme)
MTTAWKYIPVMTVALLAASCSADGGADGGDVEQQSSALVSGSTCNSQNAVGAVPGCQRSLLDTIAYAEGTRGRGKDGYDVTYAYTFYADSCNRHPFANRDCTRASGICSSASGRYQFLLETWKGQNLPNFWPENQDRAAVRLVTGKRKVSLPADRRMSGTEFSSALDKLSWEWASFPPSRYPGQNGYSRDELWKFYTTQPSCSDPVGADGCTATERANAGKFGCTCVNHAGEGGMCPGDGCTATEQQNASKFGCSCVEHKGEGGMCPGDGCTELERQNASKFGCSCVDHKGEGGMCPGDGCTELERQNASKFGCFCVDHKGAGGACPGNGCTAKETNDCAAFGSRCNGHKCVR